MSRYGFSALLLGALLLGSFVRAEGPVISEFMANNGSTLVDEDGDVSDWIEIHNESGASVELSGWSLTDDVSNLRKWTFPSVSLAAGDYLVVFASSKNRINPSSELHTNFKLSSGGEYLALVKPGGIDIATEFSPAFPDQREDVSYGFASSSTSEILLEEAQPCRTLVPTNGSLGTVWTDPGFDDRSWISGFTGMGYEAHSGYGNLIGTDLQSQMRNINPSAYMRVPFVVDDPAAVSELALKVKYDDGFAAYLNGQLVASANAPEVLEWDSEATGYQDDSDAVHFASFPIENPESILVSGSNMLALHGLNAPVNSSDFLNMPRIDATLTPTNAMAGIRYFPVPTPGGENNLGYTDYVDGPVIFSHGSGMYTGSFALSLSSSNTSAVIRYTTDGSNPVDSSPAYSAPISVTGSIQVRARLFEVGKAPGPATFGSYVFLAPDVQNFSSTMPIMVIENFGGGTIPAKGTSGTGAGVVQVPRQDAVLFLCDNKEGGDALLAQPDTISPMGIRGRGAYSTTFPQKPYSVELWDEEGNEANRKLLGMPSESDWVLAWPHPDLDQTLMYNTFLYELSNQVGHYAARTRFVNAFINEDGGALTMSDRVGMYILQEKIKRDKNRIDFEELSADGTRGGWMLGINRMDAEPIGGGTPQYFHTAGANRIQETAPNAYGQGDDEPRQSNAFLNFDEPNGYTINPVQRAAIEDWFVPFEDALWGSDFSDPDLGYERHLDADDFIDYFQIQNLAKNGDALLISLWVYKESPEGKLKMGPVWDFDFNCFLRSGSATSSLRHGGDRLWYTRLFQDIDFEQRYIDRWQAHRRNVYSDANMAAIIDAQAAQITEGIATFHGAGNWSSLVVQWKEWIALRCAAIDSQYLAMPLFSQPGAFVSPGFTVSLSSPGGGSIYYTLDGSDPRADGGGIAGGAQLYAGPIMIHSTTRVRARAKNGSSWSGIPEELFVIDQPRLAISEVMYHARDAEGVETNLIYTASDYDYIEIRNLGSTTVSLLGVQLSNGVEFDFTQSDVTDLAPGGHAVVAGNLAAFSNRYPDAANVAGEYQGELENAGERVALTGPHGMVHADFTYSDSREWPLAADGAGHALVPLTLTNQTGGVLDYGGNWRAGTFRDGSPGEADPDPVFSVLLNEFAAHTDNPDPDFPHDSDDWIELFNTAPSTQNLADWYLSDSASDLRKWAIPAGTMITSGGWISFSETDGFNNPLGSGFGLNKAGEQIFLSYLPGTGQDRVADAIRFKGQENGATLGRYPDGGVYWRVTAPTRNVANAPATQEIVISELMYHPVPTITNPADNTADEYIVLHNPTGASIDLFNASGTWRLDGDADFTLAAGSTLAAGEYLVIVSFNPTNTVQLAAFQSLYALNPGDVTLQGPFDGRLSNRSGKVALERPQAPDLAGQAISWVVVDEVFYADSPPWPSAPDGLGLALHRTDSRAPGSDPANWLQGAPSPATALIGQPPWVSNAGGVDSITATAARLNGELLDEGSDAALVTLYWGSTDGDRNVGSWSNAIPFGATGPGALSTNLTGLSGNSTYYYRYAASNSFGRSWAPATTAFSTLNPLPVITTDGAVDITLESATVQGTLVAEGCSTPEVFLCWGDHDGGTTLESWDHAASLGSSSTGPVTQALSGLAGGTAYHARFYATNACGEVWAPASVAFTTTVPPAEFGSIPFRMKIDFPGYTSGTTLPDFPALVILNESLSGFSYADCASAAGGDLRFSDSTAGIELNYEIEQWNTNGHSYVWVQIPALENDTFIYAYWGNPSFVTAPEYTTNGAAWSSSYAGVWHLNDNAGGTLPDSSANGLDGANHGATDIAGMVAGGQDFMPGATVSLGGTYVPGSSTTEAWIYRKSDMLDPALTEWGNYSLRIDQWSTPGYIGFTHRGSYDANFGVGIPVGSWHHVAWIFDGNSTLYIDGVYAGSDSKSIASALGTIGSTSSQLDARVDELRVSSVARGADYLDATYRTVAANGSFTGYLAVEDRSATVDSDGDGMVDQWEMDHSGSRTGCDPDAQTGDNDGLTYLEEFILDFNPAVSNAPFNILGIQLNPFVELEFGATSTQRFYTVEYSTNLIQGVGWQVLQSNVPGQSGSTTVADPTTNAARYYRIRGALP